MLRFGLVCPPIPGHVNPLAAVGRALLRRGHQVTMFHVQDLESQARAEGLSFIPLGTGTYPAGALQDFALRIGQLSGLASLRFAVAGACRLADIILRHGPEAMRAAGVDVVLADQNEPAGGTVAEHLGLPFVSVCTSLPLNREPQIPPPFVGWSYSDSPFAAGRNRLGYAASDRLVAPIQATLNSYRKRWKLRLLKAPDDSFSTRAQIAQMPREFDFPRERLPANFHYLGPWFDWSISPMPFPYDRLDGRPLVYASMGTLQSRDCRHFRTISEACGSLDVQLVLALGKGKGEAIGQLPGNPIVVDYAPQLDLLSRATLTITHAGMNTTMQSLYFGVPLVAIPLTHDQPAIAARLEKTGAGIVIPPSRLNSVRLREALRAALVPDNIYRMQAQRLSYACRCAGGVERAADICEQILDS
jgi:zeaxanthin glucosyltransferase